MVGEEERVMDGPQEHMGALVGGDWRVGIVVSRFNGRLSEQLLTGACDTLRRHGVADSQIEIVRVPGAWEIPLALSELARLDRFQALIALGVLVRGETPHFDFIAKETASGCAAVSKEFAVPVAFGVLTCEDSRQAEERAGGKSGNKGAEAAMAALEMADVVASLRRSRRP